MSKWPDFDELMTLAKTQPDALDQFLQNEVEEVIASAPENIQGRLRGLQFEIDCQKQLQKSPMQSCLKISHMMQASLQKLNTTLNGGFEEETPEKPVATVHKLDFA